MEATRQRRGFMKGKLVMSFYRAAKPAAASSHVQYRTKKVNPSPTASSATFQLVDQEFVVNPTSNKKKVSFVDSSDGVHEANYGYADLPYNNYSSNSTNIAGGEENVDTKAASYISNVQARFKLERANSERRAYQVVHQ